MNDDTTFWFPAKRYGWGWGLPVKWQGWVVVASYFALMYAGIHYFKAQDNVAGLLAYLAILTVVLIAIVVAKGERPTAWR